MEETFNGLKKQFKILKNQRQVENKRFKDLENLQVVMDTELTKFKQEREERQIAVRTEMKNEMEKLQNKFLQDTRKQTEDYLKMTLNTLRIIWGRYKDLCFWSYFVKKRWKEKEIKGTMKG